MAWIIKVLGSVTPGEASEIKEAQAEVDRANQQQQRAQTASSEANILLQAINIRMARKYRLQNGDLIDPDSAEIRRSVQEEPPTDEPAATS
jgi:hypothetical protein